METIEACAARRAGLNIRTKRMDYMLNSTRRTSITTGALLIIAMHRLGKR